MFVLKRCLFYRVEIIRILVILRSSELLLFWGLCFMDKFDSTWDNNLIIYYRVSNREQLVVICKSLSWDRKNSYLRFGKGSRLWIPAEQPHLRHCGVSSPNPSPIPCIVNQTQSNWNSIELIQTQLDWIHGLNSIEFGNQMKLNSHKNNWTIQLNWIFHYWTSDFCKTGVENH